jgi:hypothetical protein
LAAALFASATRQSIFTQPASYNYSLCRPTFLSDIAMDYVDGFPKIVGKSVVLTIINRFSMYAHFIALGHLYIATPVAQAFFDQVIQLHGIPCSIVNDRDVVFTSKMWQELFWLSGTN